MAYSLGEKQPPNPESQRLYNRYSIEATDLLASETNFVNDFFFSISPETLKVALLDQNNFHIETNEHTNSKMFHVNEQISAENQVDGEKRSSITKHDLFMKDG